MIFLKILKNAGIPTPKDAQEQEHYKKVFRDKFKQDFYNLVDKKGLQYIKDNEKTMYAIAKDMKDSNLKIDDIDFAAILPKIEKPKLRG
jgi:hypothetical protein